MKTFLLGDWLQSDHSSITAKFSAVDAEWGNSVLKISREYIKEYPIKLK